MMKRILTSLIFVLIAAKSAQAQTTTNDLVGLGMQPILAEYIADNVALGAKLSNAAWVKGRNQAGSADINILRLSTGDDTVINSSASDDLILQLEDDTNRVITIDAGSDTALAIEWGDAGTTAAQNLAINGSTADADDDQQLCLSGGGACADLSRGSYLTVAGLEDGDGGDAVLAGGEDTLITAVDDVTVTATDDVVIQTQGAGDIVTIAAAGTTPSVTVASTAVTVAAGIPLTGGAGSWAWALVDATNNQACTTGCGISACIFGFDSGAATLAGILACSDATADLCFCAGPAA